MRILLLNQCFYPDVVSTAQHASDLVSELTERGHEVTVVASTRAYDDPHTKFARKERWKGCDILRVPCLALGKSAKWRRILNFASFFLCCMLRLLFLRRFDVVITLTSPPLISFLGALLVCLKGGRFVFWVMDLNPDEAIAAGWLREDSKTARILGALLNFSLRVANEIVVLDRFMRDRIVAKNIESEKITIIPPWAHSEVVRFDVEGRRAFRKQHGLEGKHVVMYSGNHSPCHPLDSLLEAALRLSNRPEIAFCFVGGGSEFGKVKDFSDAHGLKNILALPYRPLAELSASLSSADLHVVVMGARLVGIVHTCKIYNIMCVGSPVLYLGPVESHVMDIAGGNGIPLSAVENGDVERVVFRILASAQQHANDSRMALRGRAFHQDRLVPRLVSLIEKAPATASYPSKVAESEPEMRKTLAATASAASSYPTGD